MSARSKSSCPVVALRRSSRYFADSNLSASIAMAFKWLSTSWIGTRSTNMMLTGVSSKAAKSIGVSRVNSAPTIFVHPSIRQCGTAIPYPSAVGPSFSRSINFLKTLCASSEGIDSAINFAAFSMAFFLLRVLMLQKVLSGASMESIFI